MCMTTCWLAGDSSINEIDPKTIFFSFMFYIYAINLALNVIKDHNGNKFIIFSDSLSGLITMQNHGWLVEIDQLMMGYVWEEIHIQLPYW